jgi:hypothetical protein
MLHRPTHKSARLPDGQPPVLLVIVDTEEEFDWTRPFDRASTGTGAIAAQPLIHERVYDRLGIVPTYVIDYPVASTEAAYTVMRDLMRAGRAEIGTHLHPWVSPPYTEAVSTFNSYAGNLPRELEYEKLRVLTETIRDNLGRAPVTFKAGRYGVGPHTADSIAALGYRVDASVVPYTAFTADGGPDFRAFREDPYWFQAGGRTLLELPATTGYCGLLRGAGPHIHALSTLKLGRAMRLGGIAARARLSERIRLTPEGGDARDMQRLTTALHRAGCQVFSMTYHSPSLAPGHTPYVRTADDLERFIGAIERYCTWFQEEFGGVFMSVSELYGELQARRNADFAGRAAASLAA